MWYDIIGPVERLSQGDIVLNFPVVSWKDEPLEYRDGEEGLFADACEVYKEDVVVMTQACDLEFNKVNNVILCPHQPLSEYKPMWEEHMRTTSQTPSAKAWTRYCEDICDGFVWNLTFLNSCEAGEVRIEQRIVDFHDVYSIPRDFLESYLRQSGVPRMRLRPPYREHLSQAFARFFMRVGLPIPVTKGW